MLLFTQTVLAVIAVTCTAAFVSKGRYNYTLVPCIVKHVMHVYVFFFVWHLVYSAKSQVQTLKDVTNDNIDGNLELRTVGLIWVKRMISNPIRLVVARAIMSESCYPLIRTNQKVYMIIFIIMCSV